MGDLERNISINSMKFYNNIGSYIHQYQDVNILKQFYMQKSRIIAARANINLPTKDLKTKCQKCCMNKLVNTSEYKITPHRLKNRFLRRIRKKVDMSKLTRYQLKCIKKIQGRLGNCLVIKCKICQNKSKEGLSKPENTKEIVRKEQNKIQKGKVVKTTPNVNAIKKNPKQQQRQNKKTTQQISKLNKFLNTTHTVKSSSLKDFIKSIT